MLPMKSHADLPRANQDGGGIFSLPDWSCPPPGQQDKLQGLRSAWSDWLAAKHIPLRVRAHVQPASEEPLFTPAEVAELRALASSWFVTQGYPSVSWEIPEFQPYALSALKSLATAISDADVSLWPSLLEGVPTGIDANIPKSNVFIPVQQERQGLVEDLHVCNGNWKQATATEQPGLLAELVAKEAQEGWIFSVPDMACQPVSAGVIGWPSANATLSAARWAMRLVAQGVSRASLSTRRCLGRTHPW